MKIKRSFSPSRRTVTVAHKRRLLVVVARVLHTRPTQFSESNFHYILPSFVVKQIYTEHIYHNENIYFSASLNSYKRYQIITIDKVIINNLIISSQTLISQDIIARQTMMSPPAQCPAVLCVSLESFLRIKSPPMF